MISLNDYTLSTEELEKKFIELFKLQHRYIFNKFLQDLKKNVRDEDKSKLDVLYVDPVSTAAAPDSTVADPDSTAADPDSTAAVPDSTDVRRFTYAMNEQLGVVFADISLREQCFPGNSTKPQNWHPEIPQKYLYDFQDEILKFEEGLSLPMICFKISMLEKNILILFAGDDITSLLLRGFAEECIEHVKHKIDRVEPVIREIYIELYKNITSEHRNIIDEFCSQAFSVDDLYQRINTYTRLSEVLLSINQKTGSSLLNRFIDMLKLREMKEQDPTKHLNRFFYEIDTALYQIGLNQKYQSLNSDLEHRIDLVCQYLNDQPTQLSSLLQNEFDEFSNMIFRLRRALKRGAPFPLSQSYQELSQWLAQNQALIYAKTDGRFQRFIEWCQHLINFIFDKVGKGPVFMKQALRQQLLIFKPAPQLGHVNHSRLTY